MFTKLLSMHLKYEVNLSKTDVIRMHASYNFTAFYIIIQTRQTQEL